MNTASVVLDLLDNWRHLPDYQLERRADILFAIYLPAFLQDRYGVEINPLLTPEFPIHIGTIYPDIPINKSFKIDYVAFDASLTRGWFIELKTDSSSRRQKQDQYLIAAQKAGLPALIDGVLKIVSATNHKHKYCCLLRLLERLKLITLPDNLDEALASQHWATAVNACLPHVVNITPDIPVEAVFLQPVSIDEHDIGFAELADWLCDKDEDAKRFAKSLRDWAGVQAGRNTQR